MDEGFVTLNPRVLMQSWLGCLNPACITTDRSEINDTYSTNKEVSAQSNRNCPWPDQRPIF